MGSDPTHLPLMLYPTYRTDAPNQLYVLILTPISLIGFTVFLVYASTIEKSEHLDLNQGHTVYKTVALSRLRYVPLCRF